MSDIYTNLLGRLRQLEAKYRRSAHDISLLAVSKQQPASSIIELVNQGQRAFGENYVQEAIAKIQQINQPHLEWHFIGKLQSNKLKAIAEHFQWVQTLVSQKQAAQLNRHCPASKVLHVCVQVNISDEAQKGGVALSEVNALAESIQALPQIQLRGLMAIGKKCESLAEQQAQFKPLQEKFHELQLLYPAVDTLSIGMSGDLEAAIAEGSTMVRVGTLLFGARQ